MVAVSEMEFDDCVFSMMMGVVERPMLPAPAADERVIVGLFITARLPDCVMLPDPPALRVAWVAALMRKVPRLMLPSFLTLGAMVLSLMVGAVRLPAKLMAPVVLPDATLPPVFVTDKVVPALDALRVICPLLTP